MVVLAKDGASPVPPESDDEKIKDEAKKDDTDKDKDKDQDKKDADKKESDKKTAEKKDDTAKDADKDKKEGDKKDADKPVEVKVDLEKIGDRILALPIPARNYGGISVGKTGVVYLARECALWPPQQRWWRSGHSRPLAVSRWKSASRRPCSATWTISLFRRTAPRCSMRARTHGPSPRPTI